MDIKNIDKTVSLDLTSIDGNDFSLMGNFQKQARREGWTKEEIDCVFDECKTGDYNHLVGTLMQFCD